VVIRVAVGVAVGRVSIGISVVQGMPPLKQKTLLTLVLEGLYVDSKWWAHQDSNLGPSGYEPVALTS
jgi:hypothetical protein